MIEKTCSKCGLTKPLGEFAKDNTKKDGVRGVCRECRREYARAYAADNQDKIRSYQKEYAERNRDKLITQRHAYYERNKSRIRSRAQEWKDNNQERVRELARRHNRAVRDLLNSFKYPCIHCGESHPAAIDFHHIDPSTKQFAISSKRARTVETLEAEVAKCVCLCSNCHRKLHTGDADVAKSVSLYSG